MRISVALALLLATSLLGQPPRTVPTPRNDYLTFVFPDAKAVLGFDTKPSAALMDALLSLSFGSKMRRKNIDGWKEADRIWVSINSTNDVLALLTGHFERGVLAAEVLKAPGFTRVFLGGPNVMLVGSEPAVRGALLRLNATKAANVPWIADAARAYSTDHDFWMAVEPAAERQQMMSGVRLLSFGAKFQEQVTVEGEIIPTSAAVVEKLLADLEAAKVRRINESPEARAMREAMTVERDGDVLVFSAAGGKLTLNQLAVEMSQQVRALVNGPEKPVVQPQALLAEEKLKTVKKGMTRDEVLGLIGKPEAVTSISGLDVARETWTYSLSTGRKATLRLDGGVVTAGSHF